MINCPMITYNRLTQYI